MILHESGDLAEYTPAQLAVLNSNKIRMYLNTHCDKVNDDPQWRRLDNDVPKDQLRDENVETWWQRVKDTKAQSGEKMWLVIYKGGAKVHDQELTAGEDELWSSCGRLAETDQPRSPAMPFDSSLLYPDESVLDEDSAFPDDATMPGLGRGRVPRNWIRIPHGSLPGASPFAVPLIARSEWDDRIKDMEQNERRLSDLRMQANIPSLHQGTTNYCWTNAVISAMLINQAKQGGTIQKLSPASVAAPIKGYRNVGGFNGEALHYIVQFGVCPQRLWPPNAIDPQLDTDASRKARKNFKITEWWELGNRRFDQLMTLLLLGIPVPIGLDWWSHEVCALDPVKLGPGRYGVRIWNSWGEVWQDRGMSTTNGMAILSQELATPDDAVAPRF